VLIIRIPESDEQTGALAFSEESSFRASLQSAICDLKRSWPHGAEKI
jgi:hypothetical protein